MSKPTSIAVALTLLLVLASVAVASGLPPQPSFSTTGYTTNLISPGDPTLPPLIPTEFEPLPSGHVKFHISAQGGPQFEDDALCKTLYNDLYMLIFGQQLPDQDTCQVLCEGFTGYPCGTTGLFENGSFIFDEWGLFYPPSTTSSQGDSVGANYGDLTIIADGASTRLRFGGQAFEDPGSGEQTVLGSFIFPGRGNKPGQSGVEGTYGGDAGYVFTVDYDFCGPWDGGGGDEDGRGSADGGSPCPPDRCAVFGSDLVLKNRRAVWRILNQGEGDLTIGSITINWPAENGQLTRIMLGGKTVYLQPQNPPYVTIDETSWFGNEDDRRIGGGTVEALRFEFEMRDISTLPSDYTILVQFAQGCAVPFVAFPGATPSTAFEEAEAS